MDSPTLYGGGLAAITGTWQWVEDMLAVGFSSPVVDNCVCYSIPDLYHVSDSVEEEHDVRFIHDCQYAHSSVN